MIGEENSKEIKAKEKKSRENVFKKSYKGWKDYFHHPVR